MSLNLSLSHAMRNLYERYHYLQSKCLPSFVINCNIPHMKKAFQGKALIDKGIINPSKASPFLFVVIAMPKIVL